MKRVIQMFAAALLVSVASPALAGIELDTTAEVEVVSTNEQGEQVVTRKQASTVVPGTEVIYTITAVNKGQDKADNVVVTNPVPPHTVYVDGSADGAGTDITFSVDGGNSYAEPAELTVTDSNGEQRSATAEDYTHLRWHYRTSLSPAQQAPVSYRAQVK